MPRPQRGDSHRDEMERWVEAMDVVGVRCDDGVTTASGTARDRGVDDVACARPSTDGTYRQRLIAVERGYLDAVVAEQ